jgi:hypothetical protein
MTANEKITRILEELEGINTEELTRAELNILKIINKEEQDEHT